MTSRDDAESLVTGSSVTVEESEEEEEDEDEEDEEVNTADESPEDGPASGSIDSAGAGSAADEAARLAGGAPSVDSIGSHSPARKQRSSKLSDLNAQSAQARSLRESQVSRDAFMKEIGQSLGGKDSILGDLQREKQRTAVEPEETAAEEKGPEQERAEWLREMQLTEREMTDYKEIFDLVDVDQGGSIGEPELGRLLRIVGMHVSPEQLGVIMQEVDLDGSGEIEVRARRLQLQRAWRARRPASRRGRLLSSPPPPPPPLFPFSLTSLLR